MFNALTLLSPGTTANVNAGDNQPTYSHGQDYQSSKSLSALLVAEVALKNTIEPIIHRALAEIDSVLTEKTPTASEDEMRLLS